MPSLLKIKAFIYLFCFYIFIIFIGIYEEHLDHNIVKYMFSFSMPSLLKIKAILYFYVSYFYNFLLVFYEEHLDPNIVKAMLSCSWCSHLEALISQLKHSYEFKTLIGTHSPSCHLVWLLISFCSELGQCDT